MGPSSVSCSGRSIMRLIAFECIQARSPPVAGVMSPIPHFSNFLDHCGMLGTVMRVFLAGASLAGSVSVCPSSLLSDPFLLAGGCFVGPISVSPSFLSLT